MVLIYLKIVLKNLCIGVKFLIARTVDGTTDLQKQVHPHVYETRCQKIYWLISQILRFIITI